VKHLSLRRRLFILISALTLIAVFSVQVIVIRGAEKEISEEYNAKLISDAEILWTRISESGLAGPQPVKNEVDLQSLVAELPFADQAKIHDYAETRAFRIWINDELVSRSKNAPPDTVPRAVLGFSDVAVDGAPWRVYALQSKTGELIFEVRENLTSRDRLRREMLLGAAGPLLGLVTVLLAALFLSIDIGLSEMTRAVDAIDRRSEDDLSPLDTSSAPEELVPVFSALNGLLEKLRRTIAMERDFVDNAAHELRTPLTVLRLQSQLAARASKPAEQREAMQALETGITRASAVVEQLLMLARFGTQDAALESVNLFSLAQTSIAVNSCLPVGKNIALALEGDEKLTAATNGKLAAILLGVLLDNAFKYTPDSGNVTVRVIKTSAPGIIIDDNGPGIPADQREKVFERFFRIAGAITPGSGLGLAIARQIAERLNIQISLQSPPSGRGLRVSLWFPAAVTV
jgi:two-component system sensor histidine kinase QseC